jgi:hypothetical protein
VEYLLYKDLRRNVASITTEKKEEGNKEEENKEPGLS